MATRFDLKISDQSLGNRSSGGHPGSIGSQRCISMPMATSFFFLKECMIRMQHIVGSTVLQRSSRISEMSNRKHG